MNKVVLKLIGVFIHQVTRPLALVITATSQKIPLFKKLCISTSVLSQYWDYKIQKKLNSEEKKSSTSESVGNITIERRCDVDRVKDIHNGANILSELILYGTLTAYIINETSKSRLKEELAAEAIQHDLKVLRGEIEDLKQKFRDHQIPKKPES